jgi:small subunit ribosomal protein S2
MEACFYQHFIKFLLIFYGYPLIYLGFRLFKQNRQMTMISAEELSKNAVQYGQRTMRWNPKMKPYIYGQANGIHIFDLQQTATKLTELLQYLNEGLVHGKTILFVSTKPQTALLVPEVAKAGGFPFVTKKWFGGLLTNFETIKERIRYYKNLKEERDTGGFDKFTKKEVAKKEKEITKLEAALGGIENMRRVPDVLFVVDCKRDMTAVKEARTLGIPVVGFADSNADPDMMDIFVPCNDDSPKALNYLMGLVKQVIQNAKQVPAPKVKEIQKAA